MRKHPKAECEVCPLASVGKFVPSTLPETPGLNHGKLIAVIGESPGKQEVHTGKVFIGPSGKVLDAVLEEHGIKRSACLMGNAIACHYPETAFDKPPREAVEACRGRVLSELEEHAIDTVITVGAVAATSMINSKAGITRLRAGGPKVGSYPLEDGRAVSVIPTFHPAAALRDQTKFPYIVRDIGKVKPGGVWDTWKEPAYSVVSVPSVATKFLNILNRDGSHPVCIDTESGADKDDDFGGGIKEVLCLGIWFAGLDKVIVFTADSMNSFNRRFLGDILMRRGISAQNGKYDTVRCLNHYLGKDDVVLDIRVCRDTMLASFCLDEGKGVHGLEYMSQEYLGAPDWKYWIDESIERTKVKIRTERKARKLPLRGIFTTGRDYSLVEPEVLHKYNAFDVYNTKELDEHFEPLLEKDQVSGLYSWLLDINHMLGHVEANGMAVDLDYNAQLEVQYNEMLAGVEFGRGAEDINPRSWQQVQKFLRTMGVRVDSTNKTTLASLIAKYSVVGRDDIVDFCQSLLDHRGASKLMGTYVTGLRKNLVDGIAHPTFLLHGTSTGRPSCRNPNLQNIPRPSGLRRQFVPSKSSRVFVQADYGQAELRVLTWFSRDELMRQVFNDGTEDVFVLLCNTMYGDKFRVGSEDARKEMRVMIKTMAYGIAYGREANAIAQAFGISLQQARRQMDIFKSMVPGIMKFQQLVVDRVMAGEDLVNPFGRRRRFHLITDMNKIDVWNEAKSSLPQGTASDICLESARRVDNKGLEIRNIVYDSILTECERNEVSEVAHILRTTMVEVAEEVTDGYVKFIVDVETGETWGDFQEVA